MWTFATKTAAEIELTAKGFALNARGYWVKNSMTGGTLLASPRRCKAICEIVTRFVTGGDDYFEIRFL